MELYRMTNMPKINDYICTMRIIFCIYFLSFSSHIYSDTLQLKAATLEYPPYQYTLNGKPTGFSIDIINEASSRLNDTKIEFSFYPWKRAVFLTKNGDSDLLFNAGKSEDRKIWGKYTQTVLIHQDYVLFKKRGTHIELKSDYSNANLYSIAVRSGYLYGTRRFRDALDNNRFLGVEYSESTIQSVNMLLGGRVDIFVGDHLPVMHYLKSNGLINDIEIIKDATQIESNLIVLKWPTYLLFNKQNVTDSFIEQFDKTLAEMKQDGTYKKLYDKYQNE